MAFKDAVESFEANGFKYFTPVRIKAFIKSLFTKKIKVAKGDIIAFSEIITYKGIVCEECKVEGRCVSCKCPINDLFPIMDIGCSKGRFPEFKKLRNWDLIKYDLKNFNFKEALKEYYSETSLTEEWNEFKQQNNIKFKLENGGK